MHANKVRPAILEALQMQINDHTIDRLPSMAVTKTHDGGRALGKTNVPRFRVSFDREMYSTDAYDVDAARLRKHVMREFGNKIRLQVVQPV